MAALVARAALRATDDQATRWATYVGAYRAPDWGVLDPVAPPEKFDLDDGTPYFEAQQVDEADSPVRHRLVEVSRGVFLADNGETLDLSGDVPRWRGLRLVRVVGEPAPWQWVLVGAASLAAATWLLGTVVGTARRILWRVSPGSSTRASPWNWISATTASFTAVLVLANAALLVWAPGLVDSGFLGWLELPVTLRLLLHLPLALAVAAGCTVPLVVAGWLAGWWSRPMRTQYVAVVAGAGVVVVQLGAWQLIGWGIT
jgi:hypothetical protein